MKYSETCLTFKMDPFYENSSIQLYRKTCHLRDVWQDFENTSNYPPQQLKTEEYVVWNVL